MMKAFVCVLLMTLLIGCSHRDDEDPNPIIKIAYDSLLPSEKKEIEGDWKQAVLKVDTIHQQMGTLTDPDYEGKAAYIIVFYTGNNHSSGDIDVYVSRDKLKVIGKGYRD